MAGLSWDTVDELAEQGGNALANTARAAKNGACELYRKYPKWITKNVNVSSPLGAITRGFMDTLCKDHPQGLPPSPTKPFQGGQCACVPYNVDLVQTTEFGQQIPFTLLNIPGKIRGVKQTAFVENNITYYRWTLEAGEANCPGTVVLAQKVSELIKYTVSSVVRSNGQADTCGDPASDWAPDRQGEPPASERDRVVVVNDRGGNSFTIPIGWFQMNNDFNLNVDVGGITFKLDMGGFEFNFTFNDDGEVTENNPGKCEPDADTKRDINDILDAVDRIEEIAKRAEECACESAENTDSIKKPDPEETEEVEQPENKKKNPVPDRLAYVEIKLTQRPNKGTIQSGDGALDWMAAGWFEWCPVSGGALPRQPIHFDSSWFAVPDGIPVKEYAFTLTNGARGYAVEHKKPA